MTCIVCGNTQVAGLAGWHATCPACNYESAALSVAINAHSGPAVDEAEREAGLKALRLENFRTIVAWARRHVGVSRPRLLDVGSAHGWFLETAREQFDVLGVEPDAVVGARAAARGLPVRSGYFPDVLREGERFDVIVFNDVIEHIPDIRSALAACHARLHDGGILILNLPNSGGFFYRLSKLIARLGWRGPFERLWQKDLPSPHVHYFNPRNLRQLVAGQGFELTEAAELPALRARGLLERLRCAGNVPTLSLYTQYAAIICAIPVLRMFPSDIIVGVFKKKAAD
ncbi:class I SAM-dependent methyltransferase [Massilia oculi]|nr:class I SAM-dependent methyltransferase [Massilia oculi]